ncbi:MAG TPA: proline--tRNA ligase [Candidatus Nanoarchaeia archaeon]|nr:proline--tRNA ligase [Candidatus Nanoarchaeia archaeon]
MAYKKGTPLPVAKKKEGKEEMGITVKKAEDPSEWFTQVIQKGELIEYTDVSGCYILRPNAYSIWEKIQQFIDAEIKKHGVRNTSFPLLIPEKLLKKETAHVKGFAPEVAWVTETGHSVLDERLAVRPTSETIMYPAFSKWIRSYKDLPLKINQWCSVVRWEFNNPVPFLRSREFLWQEGHTVFATKKEADEDVLIALGIYTSVFEELLAIPVIAGRKSDKEKFAGADYTTSVEVFLPVGKGIQGATSHHLGQNFAKAFGIRFTDAKEKEEFAYQNSWGMTTRTIGTMILMHGDNKGLVLPPRIAPVQAVIVPIIFEKEKEKILGEGQKIKRELEKSLSVLLDDREGYTPGWKFNDWEMKGVPVRIEIGPRDLAEKKAVLVRRDTGEKKAVLLSGINKEVNALLEEIQTNLLNKAKIFLKESIKNISSLKELEVAVKDKKLAFAPWCGGAKCEEEIKIRSGGAKSLNIPFDQPKMKAGQQCFACGEKARYSVYFGKSY